MANSRFEYVKEFESDPALLRDCWAVVRIDGQSFHKYGHTTHGLHVQRPIVDIPEYLIA